MHKYPPPLLNEMHYCISSNQKNSVDLKGSHGSRRYPLFQTSVGIKLVGRDARSDKPTFSITDMTT